MSAKTALSAVLALSSSLLAAPALAKDLGSYGETFEIGEEDLLHQIARKLSEMQGDGTLARMETDFVERAKAKILRPTPVAGLSPATSDRSWTYDPSWTAPEDIYGPEGQLIILAGSVINPLDAYRMRQPLLLFDGDDPAQVAWAEAELLAAPGGVKLILVSGAPLELEQAFERPIFFDQKGLITSKFGISHTPARISQDGRLLKVEEIAP